MAICFQPMCLIRCWRRCISRIRIKSSPLRLRQSVPPRVLGAEPEHDWCFYFTRAALAQQAADWQTVVAMGQAADTEGFSAEPGFGDEYLPFIEGYARTGDFDRAFVLTDAAAPDAGPGLCKLWNRIEQSSQLDETEVEKIHNVKDDPGLFILKKSKKEHVSFRTNLFCMKEYEKCKAI